MCPRFFILKDPIYIKSFSRPKSINGGCGFWLLPGAGEEEGGSDLHWTDRSQPIKIIIPFDEDWCCVSGRAVNEPTRTFTV